jgi:hypothetical protein
MEGFSGTCIHSPAVWNLKGGHCNKAGRQWNEPADVEGSEHCCIHKPDGEGNCSCV